MTSTPAKHPWFAPEDRARITDVVRRVEAGTSAEVVVTVRAAADAYREAHTIAGLVPSLGILLVYLHAPITFTDDLVAPAIVLAFTLGFITSTRVAAVRRALTTHTRRRAAVHAAACAAFVDQAIATTRDRTGILVFVSLLERRVELLADTGITTAALPPTWPAAIAALERSLADSPGTTAFEAALAGLAAPLAHALPRQADDPNELPDGVQP